MSTEKLTQRLTPIRIDKPLESELARISEQLHLTKSQVIRASIHLVIEKPSEIERIMKEMEAETDAWYAKRNKDPNNGDSRPLSEEQATEKANALKKILMEP